MKISPKGILSFTLALIALAANADETGPKPLAQYFMAQFYEVNAQDVEVTTLDETPRFVTVLARVKDHACRMEMAPAPADAQARFGWLVGSMQCEQ